MKSIIASTLIFVLTLILTSCGINYATNTSDSIMVTGKRNVVKKYDKTQNNKNETQNILDVILEIKNSTSFSEQHKFYNQIIELEEDTKSLQSKYDDNVNPTKLEKKKLDSEHKRLHDKVKLLLEKF